MGIAVNHPALSTIDFKKKKFVVPPSGGSVVKQKFRLKPVLRTKHFLEHHRYGPVLNCALQPQL
jgi:hypothetical protein